MQKVKEKSLLLKALGIERNRLRWYSALPSEMYTLIHFLSLKEGYCYANDEYLSKKLSVSVGAVRSALKKIKKEKWVLIEPKYKTVTSYSKGKLVTKQVRCGRKIYPIFRIKTDINLNIDSKNVIEDINKKESENYGKELPEKSRIISDKSLNVSQKNANVQHNSDERSSRLKTQQSHMSVGVEAEKKDRNLLTKLTNREKEEYITKATTTLLLSNKGKIAQRKNEEVAVAENDLFSSEPFKGEETEKEIFENNNELDKKTRKKLDIQNNYDFEKLEEKDAQKKALENEIEADAKLLHPQNLSKKQLYKTIDFVQQQKTTNISSTTSTKIKQLKDEFFELGKLYYENQTFLGELRTIMAKDYRKAREQYMRLCLVGKANKDAVLYEIRQYLHWLELNRSKRKQKLFSFMISPYRDWEDAKERAASEKRSCEEDIDISKKLILLDPFDTPEEKAQALKRLEGGDDFSEENCDTSYASTEVVDDMKKKSLPKKQLEEEFDKAWELYPRKKGKEKARKYFERDRNDGVDFEKILHGVKCYAAEIENDGTDEEFIKHGSTWFNGKFWADYEGLELEKFSKNKSNGKKDTKQKVVEAPVSRDCTPEEIREEEESDYEYALRDKEFLGGQWPTSYLRFMPEWVREKEGISKEQLQEWIEHPRNHF